MRTFVFIALLSASTLSFCAAQSSHKITPELGDDLKNNRGLALARFSEHEAMVELRFFDGRREKVPLEINGEIKVISQGKIVVVDLDPDFRRKLADAALRGNRTVILELFARLGGN